MTHGSPQIALGELVLPVSTCNPETGMSEADFRYIDLSSVNQQTKTIELDRRVQVADTPSRARQLIKAGDVLVSTVRPNLNAVAVVPNRLDGAIASTGFCVLRPNPELLRSEYLFHWVRTESFISEMVRRATGASYPAVSDRIVCESAIPLPQIEEQRRIAAILDKADALRQKRRLAVQKLDSLILAIFFDMFGDPTTFSIKVSPVPLADFVRSDDGINYGVVQPGDDFEGGVPLVRVGDFTNGRIDLTSQKMIDPKIEAQYSRSRLRGDELLISCVGSIGTTALCRPDMRGMNIARAVARVPADPTVIDSTFLLFYLKTPYIQHYFQSQVRTVNQPTLNIKQINETPVYAPAIGLQKTFALRARKLLAIRDKCASLDERLETFFSAIQHRAFQGEL